MKYLSQPIKETKFPNSKIYSRFNKILALWQINNKKENVTFYIDNAIIIFNVSIEIKIIFYIRCLPALLYLWLN